MHCFGQRRVIEAIGGHRRDPAAEDTHDAHRDVGAPAGRGDAIGGAADEPPPARVDRDAGIIGLRHAEYAVGELAGFVGGESVTDRRLHGHGAPHAVLMMV